MDPTNDRADLGWWPSFLLLDPKRFKVWGGVATLGVSGFWGC